MPKTVLSVDDTIIIGHSVADPLVGEMDCLYKYRHLVENVFARLKHFRAIATRYDKLKRNFEGTIALACAFIRLPM